MHNHPEHHRQSIRLKGYDYSQNGWYYVTICTQNRKCLFGEIIENQMQLHEAGKLTQNFWSKIPEHFHEVVVDEFIVMPNHVHGIIVIEKDGDERRGEVSSSTKNLSSNGAETAPSFGQRDVSNLGERTSPLRVITLGKIVAYYKYQTTKRINEIYKNPAKKLWQRNYYERIIRNEKELNSIREYIVNNPLQWSMDEENPNRVIKNFPPPMF